MSPDFDMILKGLQDRWLGNKKIKLATPSGENAGGVKTARIVFDDGSAEEYTEKMLTAEGVVTLQPQDLTEFRDKRLAGIVREFLITIRDYSPREKEINAIVGKFEASLVESITKAQCVLWGIENPGEETIGDVDKVLLNAKKTLKDVL